MQLFIDIKNILDIKHVPSFISLQWPGLRKINEFFHWNLVSLLKSTNQIQEEMCQERFWKGVPERAYKILNIYSSSEIIFGNNATFHHKENATYVISSKMISTDHK